MSSKKRSGFVLLLFALVLFSSVFVSAGYFGPLHTQVITCTKSTPTIFTCNLPYSMNVTNFTVVANIPGGSSLASCQFNLSINGSSQTPIYVDPTSAFSTVNVKNPKYQYMNFIFSPTTGLKRSPMEVKTIFIGSTLSCQRVTEKIDVYNITIMGQYDLPIINETVAIPLTAMPAQNAPINLPLASENLEVTRVDLNFTILSSSPVACPILVYVKSNQKTMLIGDPKGNNIGSLTSGSNASFSYSVPFPFKNNQIVISTNTYYPASGTNKALCYKNIFNLTKVVVRGRTTTACTPVWRTIADWHRFGSNTTHQELNETDGCGNVRVSYQPIAIVDNSCSAKCGNISSAIAQPLITSFPLVCDYKEKCNRSINFKSDSPNVVYDLVWKYYYRDGNSTEICACNGDNEKEGHKVRVSNSPVTLKVSDDNTRIISSVELRVYAFNGTFRSSYATAKLNYIDYGCSSNCDVLGKTQDIPDSNPTNYQRCEKVPHSFCFQMVNVSCADNVDNDAMWFNPQTGRCQYNGTYRCTEEDNSPQRSFCNFSTISLSKATPKTPASMGICGLDSFNVGCYQCDSGYKYDSTKGYCTKCVGNQKVVGCEQNGGICNNSLTFNGISRNESYDCCNPEFNCFKCPEGSHFRNNVCVSNICAEDTLHRKPLNTTAHVIFGVNTTTNSSFEMLWNYVEGSVGACQWTCALGYKLNESDNVSCIEKEKFNCTEDMGICSSLVISNSTENPAGNCTNSADRCFICKDGLKPNVAKTACVPKSCEDDGLIDNGIECVKNISCPNDKCTVKRKGNEVCVNDGAKLKIGNSEKYCDMIDHKFKSLLENNAVCTSKDQCKSNLCAVNGTGTMVCLDVRSQVNFITNALISLNCFLTNGFSYTSTAYRTCVDSAKQQAGLNNLQ